MHFFKNSKEFTSVIIGHEVSFLPTTGQLSQFLFLLKTHIFTRQPTQFVSAIALQSCGGPTTSPIDQHGDVNAWAVQQTTTQQLNTYITVIYRQSKQAQVDSKRLFITFQQTDANKQEQQTSARPDTKRYLQADAGEYGACLWPNRDPSVLMLFTPPPPINSAGLSNCARKHNLMNTNCCSHTAPN